MQVDDRVSLRTWDWRESGTKYVAQVVRFGASDAVSLLSLNSIWENPYPNEHWVGWALSRNPGHLLNPPGEIAAFFPDEALYGRFCFGQNLSSAVGYDNEQQMHSIDMHGIIVPSRQIAVLCQIAYYAIGITVECYFREVKLSRQESDLLNITWGKYRR